MDIPLETLRQLGLTLSNPRLDPKPPDLDNWLVAYTGDRETESIAWIESVAEAFVDHLQALHGREVARLCYLEPIFLPAVLIAPDIDLSLLHSDAEQLRRMTDMGLHPDPAAWDERLAEEQDAGWECSTPSQRTDLLLEAGGSLSKLLWPVCPDEVRPLIEVT